jgi:hypothetical protein
MFMVGRQAQPAQLELLELELELLELELELLLLSRTQ